MQSQREKILEELRQQEVKYLLHVYGDEISKMRYLIQWRKNQLLQ